MEYTFSTREKNGSVCLILSYKVGHKWKQKTKQGFKTKAEARRYQDTLLKQVQSIPGTAPLEMEKITLREFLDVFLRDKKEVLAYNSRRAYKNRVSGFKELLDLQVRDIRPADILNATRAMQGRSGKTKRQMLTALSTVFEYARMFYKIISVNPAKRIQMGRDVEMGEKKIRAFSRTEVNKLMSILNRQNPLFFILAFTAAHTGMRYSEVGGLLWENIDFEHGLIHVRQQWNRNTDGKLSLVPLKTTRSKRDIPLSPALRAEIKKWAREQPEQISGMLFPGKKLVSAHNIINKTISKNFPGRTFHSLRHTFATLLLSKTGDINLVASVLGDTVDTVSKTYLDYTQDIEQAAAKAIAGLF